MTILFSALEGFAGSQPDKPAVVEDGRARSYAELWADILRAQAWAESQGLRAGDWVGLTVSAQYLHLVLSAALLRLGCCQLTLPSFDPPESRQRLAGHVPLRWHVSDEPDHFLPQLQSLLLKDVDSLTGHALTRTAPCADLHAPRLVLTSSGTTGVPKLIGLSMARLEARYRHQLATDAVTHLHATIEQNIVKNRACKMLFEGSTLVLARDLQFAALPDLYREQRVNELWLTPPVGAQLVRQCQGLQTPLLPHARVALYGAKVEASLFQAVRACVSPATTIRYGATEIGLVTYADADCLAIEPLAVGRPVQGVTLQVVDDAYQPLPPGSLGRLGIRSEAAVSEYLFNPDASAEHFREGWFYPGDAATLREDGIVTFHGRSDDMMVLNGINIFPSEIESVAAGFPGVVDCAAYAIASSRHGSIPALAVVADADADLDALARHCRAQLGIRAPRSVLRVGAIPRNALGKVQRHLLRTPS